MCTYCRVGFCVFFFFFTFFFEREKGKKERVERSSFVVAVTIFGIEIFMNFNATEIDESENMGFYPEHPEKREKYLSARLYFCNSLFFCNICA